MVPEMRRAGYIGKKLLRQWKGAMAQHNQVIRRGNAIKALPWRVPEYSDLDLFVLKVHSKDLAILLDAFSKFGERVLRQYQKHVSEPVWKIAGPIFIEPKQWYRLCTQVANVLHMIGFDPIHRQLCDREHWPDHAILAAAASRANAIFGRFSHHDTDEPSIPARYSAECRKRAASTGIDGSSSRTKMQKKSAGVVVSDDNPPHKCSGLSTEEFTP